MICYHEDFVDIPSTKNRASLWQCCYRLTCDMLDFLPNQCFIPPFLFLTLLHTYILTEKHFLLI